MAVVWVCGTDWEVTHDSAEVPRTRIRPAPWSIPSRHALRPECVLGRRVKGEECVARLLGSVTLRLSERAQLDALKQWGMYSRAHEPKYTPPLALRHRPVLRSLGGGRVQ